MTELPQSWAWSTLGEVCNVNPRQFDNPPSDDDQVSFVPMSAVEAASGRIDGTEARPYGDARNKSLTPFQEGDVLFAKITPCMENGKVAVARGLHGKRGIGSTEFFVLRPSTAILPDYIAHYLLQEVIRRKAQRNMSGAVGQKRVPRKYLESLQIPVPPLAEQRRIVAALEDHISRLNASIELVRSAGRRTTKLLKQIIVEAVPSIVPAHWRIVTTADAGAIDLGRQRHPDWHTGDNMRPYLRVANVFEDRIDTSDVMEMDFPDEIFERFRLQPGDILLNEGQSPEFLGRPAMYRGTPPNVAFTNSLLRFRANPDVRPEWALLVFRRHLHAGRFLREVRITTNIAHLSATRFKSVEFPIPPLAEQDEIVNDVSGKLTHVARLSESTQRTDAQTTSLRRSLLAEVFSGRLVPQDPDDEPASVLLGRIKAERAAAPKPNRTRKTKTTQGGAK